MAVLFKLHKDLTAAVFGALLTAGLGRALLTCGFAWPLRSHSYGLFLVLRGEIAAGEAVIVYLDEVSHEKLKQPLNAPWDRRLHASLIDRLIAAGARAIAFD